MASNEEYQQRHYWSKDCNNFNLLLATNDGLSQELKNNGWVTEEFEGNKITYNKKFFHEVLYGDVNKLIKKDEDKNK